MKFLMLVVAVLVAWSAAESPEDVLQSYSRPTSICGRHLARAVAEVCRAYTLVYPSKRSDPNSIMDYQAPVPVYQQLPWMRLHRGEDFDMSRGKRQGIVNECCYHECNTETLLSYC